MAPGKVLAEGEMEIEGRMPWSSNGTYLVTIGDGDQAVRGVYKPVRGERPLWDFPPGLHRREAAAYELSETLGWHVVPTTIIRDGPLGEGSVQLFIAADFEEHYFSIHERRPELHDQLRQIALLDVIANNTDRKGGHCLLGQDSRVYAIDNGLCFSTEPKLRTVIWDFAGEVIDDVMLDDVARVARDVPTSIASLLDEAEVDLVQRRARRLLNTKTFPVDRSGRAYPWPLI
jgi:uncharacterized repeat protein (TIGR03843 family)